VASVREIRNALFGIPYIRINGTIILKYNLKRLRGVSMCTVFVWLIVWPNGRLL